MGCKRRRPAPFAAADVGVSRPDYAVVVCVPVLDVLLDDLGFHVRADEVGW